jgi:two-component system CheB/CheR fusion protein
MKKKPAKRRAAKVGRDASAMGQERPRSGSEGRSRAAGPAKVTTGARASGSTGVRKVLGAQGAQKDRSDSADANRAEGKPGERTGLLQKITESATPFPVVGIGASAGGLEALEQFLKHVPERSGMAFVIVSHLDPTHKGALAALLQHATKMPVAQVKNGQKVEPDRVYVIPPGKDLSILRGTLHLMPLAAPRGLNLPIDFFFRSLAEDQQERSIGVVLSGMGSDGTLGLRAIKEKAGAAFVQSLDSAKFDGMPQSAIEAGLADVVAPVEELPVRILSYRQHASSMQRFEDLDDQKFKGALDKVYILLRAHTGNDFSHYKKSTIHRRIERRMGLHQIDKLPHYVRYLRDNPRELDQLFRELLIGVTCFFRDAPTWEHLRSESLPALLSSRPSGTAMRAWVPGCSTGEEAYSLAITFKEALESFKATKNITLQVFATDLDKEAIEKARLGLYPPGIAADVSPERLRRFFVREERGYRVNKEIREMVVFAPQNIIMDPPFTKLDLLSCRNLLIYLAPELQKKLIPLFHYCLNPGGILFLGSAETVGAFTGLFHSNDSKTRIYRRLEGGVGASAIEFPAAFLRKGATAQSESQEPTAPFSWPPANLQALCEHVLVQRFSPAAILASDKGDILYISGRTGKYLEPAIGKASMNVFAMARDGLRLELTGAFSAAIRDERPVVVRGVKVGTNGGSQTLDLTVQRLTEPKELRGTVMIVLADVTETEGSKTPQQRRVAAGVRSIQLEEELQRAHDEVQTTREEMQTSQEELKSTNEELQSTNEELQSTNEELTTSKEEMQSMNEELQTVNHELQSKVDELSRANNDMKNLLNSTDIATLFLDGDLLVRRFTTPTASIIKLIPTDAGRPITDIAREIDYPELADDAREVLRTLVFKERLVAGTRDRWFSVRILPYRTLENVIDGVVITFTDASAAKSMEATLRQQTSELRQMMEALPNLLWGCGRDGSCEYVSSQWVEYTGLGAAELTGFGWLHTIHSDERETVRQKWRAAINSATPLDVEARFRAKDGTYRWFRLRSVPIRDSQGEAVRWYGTNADIHDLQLAMEERKQMAERLIRILETADDPFFAMADGEIVSYANIAAEKFLQAKRGELVGRTMTQLLPEFSGPHLRDTLLRAAQDKREMSLDLQFMQPPQSGRYKVRAFPNTEGIAVILQRHHEDGNGRAVDET